MKEENEQECNYGTCKNCGEVDYIIDNLCKECISNQYRQQLLKLNKYKKEQEQNKSKTKWKKIKLQKALNTINLYNSILETAKKDGKDTFIAKIYQITPEKIARYYDIIKMAMANESCADISKKYKTKKQNIYYVINSLANKDENIKFFGPCKICGEVTFLFRDQCAQCFNERHKKCEPERDKKKKVKLQKALNTVNYYNSILKESNTANILEKYHINPSKITRYYNIIKMAMAQESYANIGKKYGVTRQNIEGTISMLANKDGNLALPNQLVEKGYDIKVRGQKALNTVNRYNSMLEVAKRDTSYSRVLKQYKISPERIARYYDIIKMAMAYESYASIGRKYGIPGKRINYTIKTLAEKDESIKTILLDKIKQMRSVEDKCVLGKMIAEMRKMAVKNNCLLEFKYLIEYNQSHLFDIPVGYQPTVLKIDGMPSLKLLEPYNWIVNQDGIFDVKNGLNKVCNTPVMITQKIKYFNKKKTKQYETLVLVYFYNGVWKTCEIRKDVLNSYNLNKHNIKFFGNKTFKRYFADFIRENDIPQKKAVLHRFI